MESPKKNENTTSMLNPLLETLVENQIEATIFWLFNKKINSYIACRNSQKDHSKFGCIFKDDMQSYRLADIDRKKVLISLNKE